MADKSFAWNAFAANVFNLTESELSLASSAGESLERFFRTVEPVMDKLIDNEKSEFIRKGDRLLGTTEDYVEEVDSESGSMAEPMVSNPVAFATSGDSIGSHLYSQSTVLHRSARTQEKERQEASQR